MTNRSFVVTNRFVALIFILVLTVASIGGIAAYITNPLLNYVSRADQSVPLGDERLPRAVKADRLMPKRDALLPGDSEGFSSSEAAVVVSIPLPPNRPRQAGATSTGLLNDAQLKGIKNRLRLTPEQAEQWPAVEEALRDVAHQHLQRRGTHKNNAPGKIETNSPEIQRLIAVSVPLIRQLREDQKREVRELVRMIGLGTVASYI
jgi:hypothetical protein